MLDMLNEMPGNTKSTLGNREECCIISCSLNRNDFVTTASTYVSSGTPEPQVQLCSVTAVRPACDWLVPRMNNWRKKQDYFLVLYCLALVEVLPIVRPITVFQPDRIKAAADPVVPWEPSGIEAPLCSGNWSNGLGSFLSSCGVSWGFYSKLLLLSE